MLDYDREAEHYDESRGGEARAEAAAAAYAALLVGATVEAPPTGPVLDLACGTGLVSAALGARSGRTVIGLDLSAGMLRLAARRLPGRTVRADATGLPFADGSLSAVTAVWLLHLLPSAVVAAVLAEVSRVLSSGGRFLTTTDKNGSGPDASDSQQRVIALAQPLGLVPAARGSFVGIGQRRGERPDPIYRVLAFTRESPATESR